MAATKTMQVFLSYAAADRDVAGELAKGLQKLGYDVWYSDGRLYPGDNWPLEIGKALKESDAMVVLLSPESVRSESVNREIQFALSSQNYQRKLIPVLQRPTRGFPWILKRFHIIPAGKTPAETSRRIAAVLKKGGYSLAFENRKRPPKRSFSVTLQQRSRLRR
jgi:hypothetical protein